jgi:hypothetical protein
MLNDYTANGSRAARAVSNKQPFAARRAPAINPLEDANNVPRLNPCEGVKRLRHEQLEIIISITFGYE